MRKLKRLTVILAVLLVAVLLPTQAKADYTSGDWSYTLFGNEATITRYSGHEAVIAIPEKIDGNIVVGIGYKVFSENDKLISVQLPSSITSIDSYAFQNCVQLSEITMEKAVNLSSIGPYTFSGCKALEKIVLPEKLETVGHYAFSGTTGLKEVTVKSVKLKEFYSGSNTFENAGKSSGGFKVTFEEGVTVIPKYMFYSDTEKPACVTEVKVGSTVEGIGYKAFSGCTQLTKFETAGNSKLSYIDAYGFQDCMQLNTITMEKAVNLSSIGNYAFFGCKALEKIVLPEKLENVGHYAFSGALGLKEVTVKSEKLKEFYSNGNTFENAGKSSGGFKVIFEEGVTVIPNYMFYSNTESPAYVTEVKVGSTVERVGNRAFSGCTGLTKFETDDNSKLSSIDSYAFQNCVQLNTITTEKAVNLSSIGNYAFFGCKALEKIVLPEKLETVGHYAFSDTTGLEEVTVKSEKLKEFYSNGNTFENAGKNSGGFKVIFEEGVTVIPKYMFYSNTESPAYVTEVKVGSTVDGIGYKAFSRCTELNKFEMADNSELSFIDDYAFQDCVQLKAIAMEKAVKLSSVGSYAFSGCKALEKIVLPEKLETVGYYAFSGTLGLKEVTVKSEKLKEFYFNGNTFENAGKGSGGVKVIFEEGVSCIPDDMFNSSVSEPAYVTEVEISSTVEKIGYKAFEGCTELKKISLSNARCSIYDGIYTMGEPGVTVLYGIQGSTLQSYAEKYGYQFVATCEHNAEVIAAVAATCEKDGLTEGSHCSLCNEVLKKQEVIPATGHKETIVEGRKETCTEAGLTEGSKCSVCDKVFKEQETIPATGHKDGDDDFVCDVCGEIMACQHLNTVKVEGKPATCEEDGLTEGLKCNDCGEILETQDRIPAKGHDYESKENPAATCEEDGKLVYTCKNDPTHTYFEVIPAKGHNFHKGECVVCGALDDFVNPFLDVQESDWFYQSVVWAVQNDVTGGTSAVTFSPNDSCTRAQVVTFLWAANGRPEPQLVLNPFDDVQESDWYYKPVLWAVENGITGGVSKNLFGPNQTCTRAQIVTFLYAAEGKPYVSGSSTFKDVKDNDWFAKAVKWAAKYDVTGGIGNGMFGPNNTCTRGQVVTFLYKAEQIDRDSYEEPKDSNAEAYAAYVPVVENAIDSTEKHFNVEFAEMLNCAQGYVSDLDGDGIDELLLCYCDEGNGDYNTPVTVFSVYDYENGQIKVVIDHRVIKDHETNQYDYAAVVSYEGKPYILITDTDSNGTGPGRPYWHDYKFCAYPNLEQVHIFEYSVNDGADERYYIEGKEVTKDAFAVQIENCEGLQLTKFGVERTDEHMNLIEVLDYLKK